MTDEQVFRQVVVGVDWSLTSPALCFHHYWTDRESGRGMRENVSFYCLAQTKKQEGIWEAEDGFVIQCDPYPKWEAPYERYNALAGWMWDCLRMEGLMPPSIGNTQIVFEQYAYNANGNITDMAECQGVVKNMLWNMGYSIHHVSPSAVKKALVGKGNASKDQIGDVYPAPKGTPFRSGKSAWSDCVDAYGCVLAWIKNG